MQNYRTYSNCPNVNIEYSLYLIYFKNYRACFNIWLKKYIGFYIFLEKPDILHNFAP